MFICMHCGKEIATDGNIGTSYRNHCPFCGYSVHMDRDKGDRSAKCGGLMRPIGLTFKSKKELSLVHKCEICEKVSKNRIAADDSEVMLLRVFAESKSLNLPNLKLLSVEDENELKTQLFGSKRN